MVRGDAVLPIVRDLEHIKDVTVLVNLVACVDGFCSRELPVAIIVVFNILKAVLFKGGNSVAAFTNKEDSTGHRASHQQTKEVTANLKVLVSVSFKGKEHAGVAVLFSKAVLTSVNEANVGTEVIEDHFKELLVLTERKDLTSQETEKDDIFVKPVNDVVLIVLQGIDLQGTQQQRELVCALLN